MNILYPENYKTFSSGSTCYWGSLFGSSEALALIEFAKTQQKVVLYVAKDITHYVQIQKALNFYNTSLKILGFSNWEVLAFDHFSPHPDIVSSRLKTLSQLATLKTGIYNKYFDKTFKLVGPGKLLQKKCVNKAIKFVKMGKVKQAEKALRPAVNYLMRIKCKKIILGCTELPIAIFAFKSFKKIKQSKIFLDPNYILANVAMNKY